MFARVGLLMTTFVIAAPAVAGDSSPTLAELETEVVCPTCHTTLDQSTSPVADRMRTFIRARIAAGDTKAEIKGRLVAEFGEQVLASPSKHGFNLLAWVLPPVAAVIAAGVIAVLAVHWSRRREGKDGEETLGAVDPSVEQKIDDGWAFDG